MHRFHNPLSALASRVRLTRRDHRRESELQLSGVRIPQAKRKIRARREESGEFLTLLAGQERKVLELKEELQRAEADLQILKKQWAAHEANKKRDELRQVKKLQPISLDDVTGGETTGTEDDVDDERRRKRALVERSYANQAATGTNGVSGLSRKGSKRVFEGGRHTRTLSLLEGLDLASMLLYLSCRVRFAATSNVNNEMGGNGRPIATYLSLWQKPFPPTALCLPFPRHR